MNASIRPKWNPELIAARLKLWAWSLLTKLVLGLIYVGVISEGLRFLIPALGMKLSKLPGLAELNNFEGLHRLDMAHVMAVFMLIAVWYLWERVLVLWLGHEKDCDDNGWNPAAHRQLVVALGVVILGADCILFYRAMTTVGWRGQVFSFSALLATAAYVAVLIFVTFVTVNLKRSIRKLKEK